LNADLSTLTVGSQMAPLGSAAAASRHFRLVYHEIFAKIFF